MTLTPPPAPAPALQSIPGFGQSIGSDEIVYLDIRINRIRNPSNDDDAPAPRGIAAFDLSLTYPGGSGNAVNIMAVKAAYPFVNLVHNVRNDTGTASLNAVYDTGIAYPAGAQVVEPSLQPQPPLTLVQLAPRLLGSSSESHNIVLALKTLANGWGDNMPADSTKTFVARRGDARQDGQITITDALYIAQYLAGLRGIGEDIAVINAVNAASPRLESTAAGEKITITDALFIAQFLAGLRDTSYN